MERDPAEVLADASEAGVGPLIDIGMGLDEARVSAERAGSTEGLFAAVGIHPNDPSSYGADPAGTIEELRRLAILPGVVAIGETGLDYYRDRASPALQERSFRAHIALAKQVDRTLVIHCRDAHVDVLRVLDEEGVPPRTVMHCFSGDAAFARACNERLIFCSFAGNLTYKRNDELRVAAQQVAQELLLVETDSPFLAPDPFRGRPNSPALVVHTASVLSHVRSLELDGLLQLLHVNTRRAFVI